MCTTDETDLEQVEACESGRGSDGANLNSGVFSYCHDSSYARLTFCQQKKPLQCQIMDMGETALDEPIFKDYSTSQR